MDEQNMTSADEASKALNKAIRAYVDSGMDSDEADCYCKAQELAEAIRADVLVRFRSLAYKWKRADRGEWCRSRVFSLIREIQEQDQNGIRP